MFRKKWFWIVLAVVVIGGAAAAAYARRGENGTLVTVETIQKRDLEAIVSASGKIEPKKTVNISAQTMGRVTRLAVEEGDRVKAGQFLLQIDPVTAEAAVRRDIAAVAGAATALEQSKVSLQSTRANLDIARQNMKRQQELWTAGLTTRESFERAQAELEVRESELKAREQEIKTRETQLQQQQAGLASSRHTLTQVRFDAPFDSIVTRRNVEEGENVVVGTMNNAGTVLLTVADMSVIEAEVEVDETDVPFVQIGQVAKIEIDAIPDRVFTGHVTEIGNSPIQTAGTGTTRTATNFKVTVTIDGQGNIVHEERPPRPRFSFGPPQAAMPSPTELKPGEKREEREGVFLMKDGKAAFTEVKTGIAGERYLEVLNGLQEGDQVITGPFESVRGMYQGDLVRTAPPAGARR